MSSFTSLSIGTAIAAGLALMGPVVYRDYQLYMSYGPGGLPHNAFGWAFSGGFLRLLSKEVFSTTMYEQDDDKTSWLPLAFPPRRQGSRPLIGPHPAPQRQLEQLPTQEMRQVRF